MQRHRQVESLFEASEAVEILQGFPVPRGPLVTRSSKEKHSDLSKSLEKRLILLRGYWCLLVCHNSPHFPFFWPTIYGPDLQPKNWENKYFVKICWSKWTKTQENFALFTTPHPENWAEKKIFYPPPAKILDFIPPPPLLENTKRGPGGYPTVSGNGHLGRQKSKIDILSLFGTETCCRWSKMASNGYLGVSYIMFDRKNRLFGQV